MEGKKIIKMRSMWQPKLIDTDIDVIGVYCVRLVSNTKEHVSEMR